MTIADGVHDEILVGVAGQYHGVVEYTQLGEEIQQRSGVETRRYALASLVTAMIAGVATRDIPLTELVWLRYVFHLLLMFVILAPRTGILTQLGTDMVNGFQMYLDEHNGMLGGAKVRFIVEDDKGTIDGDVAMKTPRTT